MLTDQQHPITPPPELVQQWSYDWHRAKVKHVGCAEYIATQAARWGGADRERDECLQLLDINGCHSKWIDMLRDARRPKSPSLAEQALEALEQIDGWAVANMNHLSIHDDLVTGVEAVRAALKRLQELEKGNG